MLVNPNEDQILPTAFNVLHAEVMITTQLHEKSTCEMRSQKLCARLPYPFPPPTSQVSPLSMPLITRVTFEGSCCHIRSALTLRTVVFTSIQSVFPVTSTHWFWMQHKESRTSLLLCMKVLHSLDYNNQSIPKSSLA